MRDEIDSINQTLPDAYGGSEEDLEETGVKTQMINEWSSNVMQKFCRYMKNHNELLREVAALLQLALPADIVKRNILSFLDLPVFSFDGGSYEDDWEDWEY